MEMAAEIGRRTDLPLYVHFGTLWSLPDSGANGEDADTILERVIPLLQTQATCWRIRSPATPAASSTGRAKSIKSSRRRSTRD